MKRLILVLVLAAGACALGFCLVDLRHHSREQKLAGIEGSDLAWLRTEFALSDTQFAAITELHQSYSSVCGQHCTDVMEAQTHLDELEKNHASDSEIAEAHNKVEALCAICDNATLAHLRKVASIMAPDQGRRFLALIEPHLANAPHNGARDMVH